MEHVGVYCTVFIENLPHAAVLLAVTLHMKEPWLQELR